MLVLHILIFIAHMHHAGPRTEAQAQAKSVVVFRLFTLTRTQDRRRLGRPFRSPDARSL